MGPGAAIDPLVPQNWIFIQAECIEPLWIPPMQISGMAFGCTSTVLEPLPSRPGVEHPLPLPRRRSNVKYLHTMVRVTDLDASLDFYGTQLGLKEIHRVDVESGRFTLVFLAAPGDESAQVELTHNWDPEPYDSGRSFGHLAYGVEDIYAICQRLMDAGVTINRPPRDGHMAFIRSPDNISIELLQIGDPLPKQEPWRSMPNVGEW